MKAIFYITLIALCSSLMSGCGTLYESRKDKLLQNAPLEDWGASPSEQHQEIEKKYILSVLKDPSSAQLQWTELQRAIIPSGIASPTPQLIWLSTVNVNAKNSYGGFTGAKPYKFAWVNGELFALATPRTTSHGSVYCSWQYLN